MSGNADTKDAPVNSSQTADANSGEENVKKTERDVLVDDSTGSSPTSNNSRNANQLLLDFVNLPRACIPDESLAQYLVKLFQNGITCSLPPGPPLLLHGKGRFIRVVDGKVEVTAEEDAIKYVQDLIDNRVVCSNVDKTESSSETEGVEPSREPEASADAGKGSESGDESKMKANIKSEKDHSQVGVKEGSNDIEGKKDAKDEQSKTEEDVATKKDTEELKVPGENVKPKKEDKIDEGSTKIKEGPEREEKKVSTAHDLDTQPGAYDIKLVRTGGLPFDVAKHKGNQRFLQILQRNVAILIGDPEFATPPTRVKTALAVVKETKNVFEEVNGRFFVKDPEGDDWTRLSEVKTAEFVLASVFDVYFQKDVHNNKVQSAPSSITKEDLKSLIPTIGTAEISQFVDYSKPSTSPIATPIESDVLFGRGGMTNNHAGNKRFRDVISLHRPDYVRAIKIEKPNVARRIVAAIRGGTPPGRFLKRNPIDLMWYDVGNRHATEKTSQALREKTQTEKTNGSISVEGDNRKRLLEQALYDARATRMRLSQGGGSAGVGSTDSKSLGLSIAPQVWSYGVGGDTESTATKGAGPANTKSGVAQNGGSMPDPNLRIDLKDFNMVDNTALKGPSTKIGVLDSNGDILVTDNDILCGRGGMTNHHKGNKRFRDIVALHRPDYVRANKVNKPAVARMIIKAIRSGDSPGRFLKKDEKTGKWFDIGDRRAAEKASQALREKTPEERSKLRQDQQLSDNTKPASSAASKGKLDPTKENNIMESAGVSEEMGLEQDKVSLSKDDGDGDYVMNVEKVEI
mmetsp:Transcript_4160/g.5967  ORF Transcript_4160/g.5967 Transcript_4160/m.5967 type:complete len:801 (+) Transcript_4160:100-2502(+)